MKIRLSITDGDWIESDDYSLETLAQVLDQVIRRADTLEHSLTIARGRAAKGEYSKPEWYADASLERKILAEARQKITQAAGARKKAERRAQNVQMEIPKHFLNVARDMLSPAVFNTIMEEATKRYASTQSGVEKLASYVFEVGE